MGWLFTLLGALIIGATIKALKSSNEEDDQQAQLNAFLRRHKGFFLVLGVIMFLSGLGMVTDSQPTNNEVSKQNRKPYTPEVVEPFNIGSLQANLEPFSVWVTMKGDTLSFWIAPKFDMSNRPHASNIASGAYYAAKYFCKTDYPNTGSISFEIGWRDRDGAPRNIVTLKGVKADLCSAYGVAKEYDEGLPNIRAGYVLLNNLVSFPVKEVDDRSALNMICENDMISKFCRQF